MAELLHNAPFSLSGKQARVAKKKKIKPFQAVDAVKSVARQRIGAPPPTRRDPDLKKHAREKHKPTLHKFLSETD